MIRDIRNGVLHQDMIQLIKQAENGEEEALKKAKIKFKKDFEDVETMQVLSSEVVYSLDSDSGTNTAYEYGDEREGTFSPYWKVTFSMASMFLDVSDKSAEQEQPVVDILVPAIK